ncbi:Methylthioribose kinase [Acinetobacter baumannii]|nr:Methylthioribose kinase [Acinetobacter baumannii]
MLLNYCGQPGLFGPRDAAAGREQRLQDVRELWLIFADRFLALCHQQSRDAALATPGYAEQFLQQVWTDAVGYCGTELIRRTIGLAHVADLDSIADADMRLDCQRHALGLGRTLIVNAPQIEHIDALLARIRQQG